MKYLLFLILLSASLTPIHGQWGISLSYLDTNPDQWEQAISGQETSGDGVYQAHYAVGVDTWFRLKATRIEFLPTLTYMISIDDRASVDFDADRMQSLSFRFNTRIYLLDLPSDCDCPTWGKDGNWFSKGFFINIGPGASYYSFDSSIPVPDGTRQSLNSTDFKFDLALGLGLDIGISDMVTITPYFNRHIRPNVSYDDVSPDESIQKDDLFFSELGVRFGFRPDYRR